MPMQKFVEVTTDLR